jgi:DNA (cytosine-5)-methyltransferase 3A
MIKLLIGGSPCTKWSVARTKDRETTASGIGWELFVNYLIAKARFKPDLFLYENNESAAPEIQEQISYELGVELAHINSGLLSAQSRERFYAFNWEAEMPKEKGLVLKDIILPAEAVPSKYWYTDKPYTLLDTDKVVCASLDIKAMDIIKRVHNINFKSPTLTCDGKGGHRVKKILQDGKPRKLMPIEYERLQTLPDNYTKAISDSQRYNTIGNGWTADIIIHILSYALSGVDKNEKIIVLSMYDGIATGRYCLDKMGFTNVEYYAIEIDEHAKKVANDNYPDIMQYGDAFQMRDNAFNINGLLSEVII